MEDSSRSGPPSPRAPEPRGGRRLAQAVVTALVLLALVIVCYLLGRTAFFVLICAVVLVALFELLDALVQAGRRPVLPYGLACGFAMLLVSFLRAPRLLGAVLAVTMIGAFLLSLRPGRGPTPASDAAWTLLAVGWVGGGGAAATSIMMLPGGLRLLVAFVLTTALDDIGGYFAGTAFGKHKMAPSISPSKSWEGFVGGFCAALAGGALFAAMVPELDLLEGLSIGVIAGLLAPVGDLVESLAKRELGVKDSGRLLPGHGGFLDRLDAILFCAPVVFLYLAFVAP
ncbi:MAG: phosphatidate cytidylyltransferase [Actinomycetota bacterium]